MEVNRFRVIALEAHVPDITERMHHVRRANDVAREWDTFLDAQKRAVVRSLIRRVELGEASLQVRVDTARLQTVMDTTENSTTAFWKDQGTKDEKRESELALTIPAQLKRAGMEIRLVIDGPDPEARSSPDVSLHRLLGQAYRFRALLMESRGTSVERIATEKGIDPAHFARLVKVSFLAPGLVGMILRDEHPVALNAKRLSRHTDLPVSWNGQKELLGVG